MIPLLGFPKELKLQIEIVNRVANESLRKRRQSLNISSAP
jgi:hypothetical protein